MTIHLTEHEFAKLANANVEPRQRRRPRRKPLNSTTVSSETGERRTEAIQERTVKKKRQVRKANGYAKETDLVRAIVQYITWRGGMATRVNSGLQILDKGKQQQRAFRGATKGTSDILACWQGRYLAIECKMPGNHPTEEQGYFLEQVERSGGVAIVAYTIEDVSRAMDDIAQEQK